MYCAPEIFEGQPYDEKADIYSYGVCIYELMHGRPPWADAHNVAGLARRVLRLGGDTEDNEPKLDTGFSEDLRNFVKRCLGRYPEERLSAADLLSCVPQVHRSTVGLENAVRLPDVSDASDDPAGSTPAGMRVRRESPARGGTLAAKPSFPSTAGALQGNKAAEEAQLAHSQDPRLAVLLQAALAKVAPAAIIIGKEGVREVPDPDSGQASANVPEPDSPSPQPLVLAAAEACTLAAGSCSDQQRGAALAGCESTINLEEIDATVQTTQIVDQPRCAEARLVSVAPPAAACLGGRPVEDAMAAKAEVAGSLPSRPSTKSSGTPMRSPGPLAYVARAHEFLRRFKRERQEARLKLSAARRGGAGGFAPELGLEIRGVAPARTPKAPRVIGRL